MKRSVFNINFKIFNKTFIIIFLFNHFLVSAQTDTLKYPTGLRKPTKEEIEWNKKHLINTVKVFPNEIALRRFNNSPGAATRAKKAYFPEVNLKPLGEEMVGYTGEDSLVSSEVAKGLEDSDYLLPVAVDNSELPFFPGIGNQGSLGSCDDFSKIYYTLTHTTGLMRNWTSAEKIFSPAWIYNHEFMVRDGLTYHGCATMDEFFYDGIDDKKWCTDANVWKNALSVRLSSRGKIAYVSPDNYNSFNNLKQMLANGYILNFFTYINNWNYTIIKDNIYSNGDNEYIGEGACRAVCGKLSTGHLMTIVGYNDDIWVDINENQVVDDGELGAFKIANSWGTSWGNNGYMWFAYDALKQYSNIPGAPGAERLTGWGANNEAFWLIPERNDYKPVLVSEITLRHSRRNQINLWLGVSDTNVYIPEYTWHPGILQNGGRNYAFDGTTVPCDGSFAFDYTDLIAENKIDTGKILRWYIGVSDNTVNDSTTIKAFKLIDMFNGETELTSNNLPVSFDNSIKYVFIDCKIGSKANKAPVIEIGRDTVVFRKDTLTVTALAADDNLPENRILKYKWEILLKNNGANIINSDSLTCHVVFEETGEYMLRCTVDDGEFKTSDDKRIYVSNLDLLSQIIHGEISSESSGKIHYSGDYLLAGSSTDLSIFDVSNKTNPVVLGNYKTSGIIYNIDATENYAYISLGSGGLSIIDITNKSFPAYVNKYRGWISDAKIKDNYAYILNTYSGALIVLDVSDKNNLSEIGSLDLKIGFSSCMRISGNFIFISAPFSIIDISDISNLRIIYSDPAISGSTLNIAGEYAFIDDKIVNIKDYHNPVVMSNFNIKGKCEYIQGNCAYISSYEGISVYNISDKHFPQQIGFYPNTLYTGGGTIYSYDGSHQDIYACKDYIYTVNQDSPGLQIFKADLLNTKPNVYIYSDSISSDTARVKITATAADDGTPVDSSLKVFWTRIASPGPVEFDDSTQLNIKADFYKNGSYIFKLTASDGELYNSDTIKININMPVSIEQQPISASGCERGEAHFLIKSRDNESVNYSWLRNGTSLVENERYHGVHSDSLFIENTNINDCGVYSCLITTGNFALESKKATLIINDLPAVDIGIDTTIDSNDNIVLNAGNGYVSYVWSNGSPEQVITLTKLNAGDYNFSVKVTDNNNCSNTDTITLHVKAATSIPEISGSSGLRIFPNPTSGLLYIRSDTDIETDLTVKLIDQSGKVVFVKTSDNSEVKAGITLNLSNLKNGVYILRINNSDIVRIHKVIKY
jgi:hypothetical protein